MTVLNIADVEYLRYRGFDEPQFPTGIWRAVQTVTGDGSGGQSIIQVDFTKASQGFNSQLYSLEQVMMTHNVASQAVGMQLSNFDQSLITPSYTLNILANEGLIPAGQEDDSLNAFRGLWLGQQVARNSAQALSFIIDNGNGEIMTLLIYGYVWSARSINAPGGPQRPPQGIFRA